MALYCDSGSINGVNYVNEVLADGLNNVSANVNTCFSLTFP